MRVVREDVNPCTVNLTVTCSPDQVNTGVKKAVKALSKRVRIPGFRPGAAPISVIEQMLSPQEIDALAQEETVSLTFKSAIASEGLELGGQATIVQVEFDRATAKCEYTVKVPLAPKVEIGQYKGLAAEKFRVEVSGEEIERQVEEIRSRSGTKKPVERGINPGDSALVNIKVEGEGGDGRNFMIVAGQTFEDLDEAVKDMAADDIKSVELGFPDSFQEKDLAGKTMKCTVTVRSVSAIELPDLDDEFAKSLNLDSLDQLRDNIRQHIQSAKENMVTEMLNERLLEQIMSNSEVHVPDNFWESVAEQRIESIRQEAESKGANLEQVAQENGMDVQKLREAIRQEAKVQVHRAQVIDHIFGQEGLRVTDQDANAEFIRIATENRVPEKDLKRFAKENALAIRNEIFTRVAYAKVMALVREAAIVTEIDPPANPGNPEARGGRKKKGE